MATRQDGQVKSSRCFHLAGNSPDPIALSRRAAAPGPVKGTRNRIMTSRRYEELSSLNNVIIFAVHFWKHCYVLRTGLSLLLVLIVLTGFGFAQCEGIPPSQGVYFALITATTVGYGDITPSTGLGQCLAVMLAFLGTITFGLVVAVATRAGKVTFEEQIHQPADTQARS